MTKNATKLTRIPPPGVTSAKTRRLLKKWKPFPIRVRGKTVILTTPRNEPLKRQDFEPVAETLRRDGARGVIAMREGVRLQDLSDKELARMGLQRIAQ